MRRIPVFLLAAGLIAGCSDRPYPQEPVVPPQEVVVLQVIPGRATMHVGQRLSLAAVARDAWGATVRGAAVAWSSSNPDVVAVSADGVVTAVALGTATVGAECGRACAGATIEVEQDTVGPYPGLAWTAELTDPELGLEAVWVAPGGEVFVAGTSGWWNSDGVIFRRAGDGWHRTDFPGVVFQGIWGSAADDVYAVGNGMLRFDGTGWHEVVLPGRNVLTAVWGSSSSDVFAVGVFGTILHYDGAAWAAMPVAQAETVWLRGVWGSGPADVFAVGTEGRILHYDGAAWATMASPTAVHLTGVWGTSPDNVIAVGCDGVVLRYDGVSWSALPRLTRHSLTGVWGTAANDVYVVGYAGTWPSPGLDLLHFDGAGWKLWQVPGMWAAGAIAGSAAGDVYLVGSGPSVLHGRPVQHGG